MDVIVEDYEILTYCVEPAKFSMMLEEFGVDTSRIARLYRSGLLELVRCGLWRYRTTRLGRQVILRAMEAEQRHLDISRKKLELFIGEMNN